MEDWKERILNIAVEHKEVGALEFAYNELLNIIEQEIGKAREEGRREVLEDMKKNWDNDNLGDAPKYGSAGAGLMKRWIRDDINERLSKLTTK